MKVKPKTELPILPFQTQKKWRNWLSKNFEKSSGLWLKLYKKDSGVKSINHSQALEEALCFGWIDGQSKGLDEESYLQKFTPRRKNSTWSKKNTEHIERLIKEGKMHTSGMIEVELAKADGRWDMAYDSPANMKMPEDFLLELSKHPAALEFFNKLNKTNTFAIAFRLQTAKKPETRVKRMNTIIHMLEEGKKFH